MSELLTDLDPPGEHLSEMAAGFVGRGTKTGCARALRVLGPPPDEHSVIISDLFGGRPRKRSIQPALKRKLSRGLCHVRTLTPAASRRRRRCQVMDEITALVGRLVLPATITTVLVLVVVNVAKGRERPVREAVAKAQSHVATAAVWLALALVALFGPLESIDRWGLWVTLALNAGPLLAGGAVLAVVSIRRRAVSSTA